MKRFRKFISVVLTGACVLSLAGCIQINLPGSVSSSPAQAEPTPANSVAQAAPPVESEPAAEPSIPASSPAPSSSSLAQEKDVTVPQANGELSDEIRSYQIQVEGKVYTVPFPYSELVADGWAPDKDLNVTLEENYVMSTRMLKGDKVIEIDVSNEKDDPVLATDAMITAIDIWAFDGKKKADVLLPKGITVGSTLEEIDAAYGVPDDKYDKNSSGDTTYMYDYSGWTGVQLTINETYGLWHIEVGRMVSKT